ncbi:outer membrane protein assembly factor BamC [Acidihalobacter ferrooxydans]|uniref:Outer membrane protein assembly factor BamC n=1 Tax=Acidihalobacter ferrooxydans TaxID=1765967 RepID=A0A1P8UJB8_9GAMM|nr:outer membrane protein assembly factor BamC [Acidihalobacter ferrooxydans]APZ43902.1 hypothetical protein BW247_13060 [Acidihalobacter ferrooxydans]
MLNVLRRAALFGAVLGMGGCSLWGGSSAYPVDASTQSLQVPPNLSAPKAESTFAIPPAQGLGPTRAAAQSTAQSGPKAGVAVQSGVLPVVPKMHLRQAGAFRWLSIDAKPGQVWPKLEAFFKARGYTLVEADARTGVLRTAWKSSAGLPKGFLGQLLNLAASGARERYVVRLVRGAKADTTELYLSGQGAIKAKDSQGDMVWQWLPPNPGKEASLLQALMVYMGAPKAQATTLATAVTKTGASAFTLATADGTTVIDAAQPFAQAWPQIGLGLDRVDLVVEHQDRAAGLYTVKYVGVSQSNALQRLFGGGSVLNQGAEFKIKVVASTTGNAVVVHALDAKGKPLAPAAAHEVLKRLLSGLT